MSIVVKCELRSWKKRDLIEEELHDDCKFNTADNNSSKFVMINVPRDFLKPHNSSKLTAINYLHSPVYHQSFHACMHGFKRINNKH